MGNSSGDPGGGWGYADRVNLPLVDQPFVTVPTDAQIAAWPTPFRPRDWSPIWYAWQALTEFVQLNLALLDPGNPVGALGGPPDIASEIRELVHLARFERADALGEILAQKDEFISYFMGLINATPSSHPGTFRLLHMANLFATVAVMKFKKKYNRPRPTQISSVLLGPAPPPGHASYPSGHATQARLMALWAGQILPAAAFWDATRNNLQQLASRIARNREIAGFHYPSDSRGGSLLADKIAAAVENDRISAAVVMVTVHQTKADATAEWI